MGRPAAVVTDIEGTTTPIAFVHDVLFPYARQRLPDFLRAHAARADVASVLADTARLSPGADPLATLLGWMDADAKMGPLKTVQGLIWAEGYADGSLTGDLYPDVAPALRRWARAGVVLGVYSSGSVAAQKLLFGHTAHGDLASLFSAFFDTGVGGKREPASYAAIAQTLRLPAGDILFLSDVAAELDAAKASGMRSCQLVRPADGTLPSAAHDRAGDFDEVERLMGFGQT